MDGTGSESPQRAEPWAALEHELEQWRAAGRTASFWWRDDDASRCGPALDRLVALSKEVSVPVALAVIPAPLDTSLARDLSGALQVSILQHGWAHTNHNGKHQSGACELALHRGTAAVGAEMERGRKVLDGAFGDRFLPVMVPPWNRIAPEFLPELPHWGYAGVSTFGARREGVPGLSVNNCHCDPISWKQGGVFAGMARTLAQLVSHLHSRRTGAADPDEASGFLTHHLNMDEPAWNFTRRVLETLARHPAVRPMDAWEVFSP